MSTVDLAITEKAIGKEMSEDQVERVLVLFCRWAIRMAQRRAEVGQESGGAPGTIDFSKGYASRKAEN